MNIIYKVINISVLIVHRHMSYDNKINNDIINKFKGEIYMSHCHKGECEDYSRYGGAMSGGIAGLIIFILIILQFQKRNGHREERDGCKEGGNNQLFDNSVLFILALFIIACSGFCGRGIGYGRGRGCGRARFGY